MKKLLLSLILLAIALIPGYGQCVIDSSSSQVVTPPANSRVDSVNKIVVLPPAQVNQPYNEELQFRIPNDTGNIPITYIKIDSIVGLPPNFSLSCNPDSCFFPGGSRGCLSVSGTATAADSSKLTIYVELKSSIAPNPVNSALTTDYDFYFVVRGNPTGLVESQSLSKPRVYPNPAKDLLQLQLPAIYQREVQIQMVNMLGKVVKTYFYRHVPAELSLPVDDLKPGLYLYSITSGQQKHTGRFSISR